VARRLVDLSAVSAAPALTSLQINYVSKVVDFEPLAWSTTLSVLHVQTSSLRDLSSIAASSSIQELRLDSCRNIESLRPLLSMPNLRRLYLAGDTRILDGDIRVIFDNLRLEDFMLGCVARTYNVTARDVEEYESMIGSLGDASRPLEA